MPTQIYKNKNGERVPGTTTVIKQNLGWSNGALMYWAWDQGINGKDFRKTAEDAASSGTITHAMIDNELRGITPIMPDIKADQDIINKAENAYLAWLEWKGLVNFELLKSEHPLISEQYQYGGCIDIAAIKKETCLVDLKTGNSLYPDHLIQLAAYGNLWNENYPEDPIRAYYILRLGKEEASFHYHRWQSLPDAWEAFKHLLALHNLQKTLKKLT